MGITGAVVGVAAPVNVPVDVPVVAPGTVVVTPVPELGPATLPVLLVPPALAARVEVVATVSTEADAANHALFHASGGSRAIH